MGAKALQGQEMVEKQVIRIIGQAFCRLELRLENGRLSICGTAGRVESRKQALMEALDYWVTFFEDSPEEISAMNRANGTRFLSATSAAKYVIASDGEFHGLDVVKEEGGKVFVSESCGQIRDEIAHFFPEVVPFFKWHLNDMHAECVHQEARGETWASHPRERCSDCGYELGSQWLKRELPPEVIAFVEGVQA